MSGSLISLVLGTLAVHGPRIEMGPALERHVRFVQELTCESPSQAGWLEDVEVRVAVPRDHPRQEVRRLRFSPEPDEVLEDTHGNRVAVFRIPRLEAGQTTQVGWSADVLVREVAHKVDPSALEGLDQVPEEIRSRYLADGPKYRLRDPSLRRTAARAGAGAKDPLDLAFRLNEYVREALEYRNDGLWEDAPRVLENRHGSCSEYNFLYMALCRLNGLPARYVGATALREPAGRYVDTVHHRWTEVFLPGHGWFPVDVSRNDGEDRSTINRYFGRTAGGLLVLMKGDGGRELPLRWGYVASLNARGRAGARLSHPKRFIWDEPVPEQPAPDTSVRAGG